MASSNPLFQLFGGYYPGEPIPRRPSGGYKRPNTPSNQTAYIVDEYLEQLKKDVKDLDVGENVKSFFISDVESAFRATGGAEPDYDPVRALELGDEEELPGVQVQLDLNPIKWVKDPKKMLENTGKQIWQDFTNWEDVQSHFESNDLWQPLVKGEKVKTGPLGRWAFSEKTVGTEGPFQMRDLGVTAYQRQAVDAADGTGQYEITKPVDLFDRAGKSFLKAHRNSRSSGSRNKNYWGFVQDAGLASAMEAQMLINDGTLTGRDKAIAERYIEKAKMLRVANGVNTNWDFPQYAYSERPGEVVFKTDLDENLEKWTGTGFGTSFVTMNLENYIQGKEKGKGLIRENQYVYAVEQVLTGEDNLVTKTQKRIKDSTKKFKSSVASASGADKRRAKSEYRQFLNLTKGTKAYLREVEKIQNRVRMVGPEFGPADAKTKAKVLFYNGFKGKQAAVMLHKDLKKLDLKYKGTPFVSSPLSKTHDNFIRDNLLKGEFRDLVNRYDEFKGTKRLVNISEAAKQNHSRNSSFDQVDKFVEDGILGIAADYGRQYIRASINGLAPANFIKERLKRAQYFGLVYDPAYAKDSGIVGVNRKSFLGKNFSEMVMDSPGLRGMFANTQPLKIKTASGKRYKLNIIGSNDIKIGVDLFERFKERNTLGQYGLNFRDMVDLINGETGRLSSRGVRLGYEGYSSAITGFSNTGEILDRAKGFRLWLQKNAGELGLQFDRNGKLIIRNNEDIEKLTALLSGLKKRSSDPNYISLYQQRAGLLDKASAKLTRLRNRLFNNRLLKPFFKLARFASNWREIAAKAISKVTGKVLNFLLVSGTGGIGKVLAPVVKLVEKAVEKLAAFAIRVAEKTFESIRKGDPDILFSYITLATTRVIEVLMIIAFGAVLLVSLPANAAAEKLVASITPVDHTRESFFTDTGGFAGRAYACPPNTCPVQNVEGCFERVGTWPSSADCDPSTETCPPGAEAQVIDKVMAEINNYGGFVTKLCELYNNDIEISWDSKAVCGQASTSGASPGLVRFYYTTGKCWQYIPGDEFSETSFLFLLAHELGHLYQSADHSYDRRVEEAAELTDCGYLPTYVGPSAPNCNPNMDDIFEDFAEIIGNTIAPHNHCGYTNFPDNPRDLFYTPWYGGSGCTFSAHGDIAQEIFGYSW